jgi:hypothetical protein
VTLVFELFGPFQGWSTDFVANIIELSGFLQFFHGELAVNTHQ